MLLKAVNCPVCVGSGLFRVVRAVCLEFKGTGNSLKGKGASCFIREAFEMFSNFLSQRFILEGGVKSKVYHSKVNWNCQVE